MRSLGWRLTHFLISWWFNWDFLYALNDNWMSKLWMTGHSRGWDGGFFGCLSWAIAMLAGTLCYDLTIGSQSQATAVRRLIVWGLAFMAVGYGMSCLTRVYEFAGPQLEARRVAVLQAAGRAQLAAVTHATCADDRRWSRDLDRQVPGHRGPNGRASQSRLGGKSGGPVVGTAEGTLVAGLPGSSHPFSPRRATIRKPTRSLRSTIVRRITG